MTALTAMAFARYFSAAFMPVFAIRFAEDVPTKVLFAGYGATTLIMLPVPFVLFYHGEKWILKSGYSRRDPHQDTHVKEGEEREENSDTDEILDEKERE